MTKPAKEKSRTGKMPQWHDDSFYVALLVGSGILFGWFFKIW
ncbi:MAG TPA: hypothetical protein VMN03_09465 [Burkholderiales bacterium]|nr:hypothetical protein [Burkholderiales bacterium]